MNSNSNEGKDHQYTAENDLEQILLRSPPRRPSPATNSTSKAASGSSHVREPMLDLGDDDIDDNDILGPAFDSMKNGRRDQIGEGHMSKTKKPPLSTTMSSILSRMRVPPRPPQRPLHDDDDDMDHDDDRDVSGDSGGSFQRAGGWGRGVKSLRPENTDEEEEEEEVDHDEEDTDSDFSLVISQVKRTSSRQTMRTGSGSGSSRSSDGGGKGAGGDPDIRRRLMMRGGMDVREDDYLDQDEGYVGNIDRRFLEGSQLRRSVGNIQNKSGREDISSSGDGGRSFKRDIINDQQLDPEVRRILERSRQTRASVDATTATTTSSNLSSKPPPAGTSSKKPLLPPSFARWKDPAMLESIEAIQETRSLLRSLSGAGPPPPPTLSSAFSTATGVAMKEMRKKTVEMEYTTFAGEMGGGSSTISKEEADRIARIFKGKLGGGGGSEDGK
jgi:hypothetical protein